MKRNSAFMLVLFLALVVGGVYYFGQTGDLQGRLTQRITGTNTPTQSQTTNQLAGIVQAPSFTSIVTQPIVGGLLQGNPEQVLWNGLFSYAIGTTTPFSMSNYQIKVLSATDDLIFDVDGDGVKETKAIQYIMMEDTRNGGAGFPETLSVNELNADLVACPSCDSVQTFTGPTLTFGQSGQYNDVFRVLSYVDYRLPSGSQVQICLTGLASATYRDANNVLMSAPATLPPNEVCQYVLTAP